RRLLRRSGLGSWLGWFVDHGTGPCYLDQGCSGPAMPQLSLAHNVIAPVTVLPYLFFVFGYIPAILLAALTLLVGWRRRGIGPVLRVAVLASGAALLALGL